MGCPMTHLSHNGNGSSIWDHYHCLFQPRKPPGTRSLRRLDKSIQTWDIPWPINPIMRTAHRFWITTTVFFNPENPPHFSIKNFKKKFYSVFWLRKATLIFADFFVRKCAWEKFKFKNSTLCILGERCTLEVWKMGVRLSSGCPIIWSIQLVKSSGGRFHHLTFLDPLTKNWRVQRGSDSSWRSWWT